MGNRLPEGWRAIYLSVLQNTGNMRAACLAAGVKRSDVERIQKREPRFRDQCAEMMEDAIDLLEVEAWSRAKTESDGLLMFLLRANRPKVYREFHRMELSGPGGGPIEAGLSLPELYREDIAEQERARRERHRTEWAAGSSKSSPPKAPTKKPDDS